MTRTLNIKKLLEYLKLKLNLKKEEKNITPINTIKAPDLLELSNRHQAIKNIYGENDKDIKVCPSCHANTDTLITCDQCKTLGCDNCLIYDPSKEKYYCENCWYA